MSMPDHTDEPVAAAGGKVASYLSLATVAAEAIAQLAAARARERAVTHERTAAALRAQRQAAYSQARLGAQPSLDPKLRERTGVLDAGLVWAKAQAWRPDPAAERASDLAEDRLRDLRPDVMERYDRLRAEGTDPVEAMRRVAAGFDAPPMWTGQPGPDRAALPEQAATRRPGDAEITRYRGETALPGRDRHHPARHRPAGVPAARIARWPGPDGLAFALREPTPDPVGLRCRQRMGTAVRDNGTTPADGRRGLLPSAMFRPSFAVRMEEQLRVGAPAGSVPLPPPLLG